MNKEQNELLETLLEQVQKPARYTGGEMNTTVKAWNDTDIRFAFCFPDTYEIGMSHLGIKILYHIINKMPYALCERVFMPWTDMNALMRKNDLPLFSIESRTPVRDFDIVGFTLQYEMSYTNILEMLDLAGIPLKGSERTDDMPIVVAGGPCAFNPEPLAQFVDAFMIGDGEEVMIQLVDTIRAWKKSGAPRIECLKALSKLGGVYVPALYDVSYNADGTISAFTPHDGAPEKVTKCLVMDMNKADYPDNIPVPYTEIVHDRIMLEIMRGCTRGCRFCQAGMLYRPVRERSVERLEELAQKLVDSTGYEEISLSSLSSGDYSCLPELIRGLMERFSEKKVGVSLPSMRIDSIVKQTLEETKQVRKSGLTLAPEAGTQRLRDVINKGVTAENLMDSVTDAFKSGWSSVKLYFMIGLPTETDEDLAGIGQLAQSVVRAYFALPREERAKGLRVACSASTFVPKAFTPFQWEPQDTLEMIKEKQGKLRHILNIKGVQFHWHEPELSFMEACFARGDRRMGDVLLAAWKRGCQLDGWAEQFKYNEWMNAFTDCHVEPAFYANRRREKDEILPWAFIDAGVTQNYLWLEHERAMNAEVTRDCRKGCNGCGLQRFEGVCAK